MNKDLFSKQSDLYAKYRPGYHTELLSYILQFVSERKKAWDCATGNGQAAVLLASFFEMVEATDASERQISNAMQATNVHYSVSSAEKTPFANNSFDLVTVAQAYHWFDFISFEKEVRRVSKPGGVVAVWGYGLVQSAHDELNSVITSFYTNTLGSYWDAERRYVDEHYRTIPFPYEELPANEFFIDQNWNQQDLIGYFNTWSSVQHFIKAKNFNPVDELIPLMQNAWPEQDVLVFRFPLFLRIGRIS